MFTKVLFVQVLLGFLLLQNQRVHGHARLIYSCPTANGVRIFVHFNHFSSQSGPAVLGQLVIDGVPTFPDGIVDEVFDPINQLPDLNLCPPDSVVENACCEDETTGGCTPIGTGPFQLGWAYFDVPIGPETGCVIELSDTTLNGECLQCDSGDSFLNGDCLSFFDGEPYGPPLYPVYIENPSNVTCLPTASPSIAPSSSVLGECDGCVFMNQVLGDPVDSAMTVEDDFCRMKLFPILIEGESGSCSSDDFPTQRCEETRCSMDVSIRFRIGNSECFGSCQLVVYDEFAGQFLVIDSTVKPQSVEYSRALPCSCDSRRLKVVFSCNPKAGPGLQTITHSAIYTCSECTLYPL